MSSTDSQTNLLVSGMNDGMQDELFNDQKTFKGGFKKKLLRVARELSISITAYILFVLGN